MKTEWDYTELADAYLYRPGYAREAIDKMLEVCGVKEGDNVCDVGAGAAHLTLELARKNLNVCAVEPNDAMRANGIKRTEEYHNVKWFEGVGENTGMDSGKFQLVTFGSSFNVCDRAKALIETDRILRSGGYFACMWNHRDLEDPLQKEIEDVIKQNIANYDYGSRREDQVHIIDASGLFEEVQFLSGKIEHSMNAGDFIEGWKSHGTVHRQSPHVFNNVIKEIGQVVESLHQDTIIVPYVTRIWTARVKR